MKRTTATLLGIALLAIGAYAYIAIPARTDWPALILMLVGAHLVSKTQIVAALKSLAEHLPSIRT